MCAASYLAKLVDANMETFKSCLGRIAYENLSQMETFLRFACGLSVSAAEYILQHVVQIMYGRWKRARDMIKHGLKYDDGSESLENAHGYQRMPLLLLYEADVNTHANNCSNIHRSMKPLYNSISVEQLAIYEAFGEFQEVLNYFIKKEGYTWLDDVAEIEIGIQKLPFQDTYIKDTKRILQHREQHRELNIRTIELLCSLTRVSVVRLKNSDTKEPVQLATFLDPLIEHHFAPLSLLELYLHGVCCDATPLGALLSALSCLKKLDLYDVSIKGKVSAVSLLRLTYLNITMDKGPNGTGNKMTGVEEVPTPYSKTGFGTLPVYAKYYFSTTVLFYRLFSSLFSLTKLKLVDVALDGGFSRSISFPSLKDLHIEGVCHNLIMMILCGFSQTTLSHDQGRSSSGSHYCVPLVSIYIKNIRFDEALLLLRKAMQHMPHLRRLLLPFDIYELSSENEFRGIKVDEWEKIFDCFAGTLQQMKKCKCNSEGYSELQEVDLSGNYMYFGYSAKKFVSASRYMPELRYLNVNSGSCRVPFLDPGFLAFLHVPNLKVLDLSYARLTSFLCALLFNGFIAAGISMSDVGIPPPRCLKMETLILRNNDIGVSVQKFCEALRHMSCLRKLDVSICGLKDERKVMVEAVLKATIPDYTHYHVNTNFLID